MSIINGHFVQHYRHNYENGIQLKNQRKTLSFDLNGGKITISLGRCRFDGVADARTEVIQPNSNYLNGK